MSKTHSKRARKVRARRRAQAKIMCAIDYEVRNMTALELGTRVHQEIERVMTGHYHVRDHHIGEGHEQVMAYASMVPGCEIEIIMGGDLVHHKVERPPVGEQSIYNLGYDNPATLHKRFAWRHVTELNAYRCGQMDRQNQHPRNSEYRREDYEPISGDRIFNDDKDE
jgi:hypothetical protein